MLNRALTLLLAIVLVIVVIALLAGPTILAHS